jgi:heme-degrading monooxygenase HmoA
MKFTGPCIAVIFISQLKEGDELRTRYGKLARKISELAMQQPGYIHEESSRSPDGFGVSVSYWKDTESALAWKANPTHEAAQRAGKEQFYEWYQVRIANVSREYGHQAYGE